LDEVFGAENFCSTITYTKTSGASSPDARTNVLPVVTDTILWYARDASQVKFRQPMAPTMRGTGSAAPSQWIEEADGTRRRATPGEMLPEGARSFTLSDLTSQKPTTVFDYSFEGV